MKSRAAFYDQPLLSYGSFSRTSSAAFLDKKTDKYKIFKIFCQKKRKTVSNISKKTKKIQFQTQWLQICGEYCPKFRK